MRVDHTCRNRKCVNPSHLRLVTPKINAIENSGSVSAINHAKKFCKNNHELTVENTKFRLSNGRIIRRCKICIKIEYKRNYNKTKLARQTLKELRGEK